MHVCYVDSWKLGSSTLKRQSRCGKKCFIGGKSMEQTPYWRYQLYFELHNLKWRVFPIESLGVIGTCMIFLFSLYADTAGFQWNGWLYISFYVNYAIDTWIRIATNTWVLRTSNLKSWTKFCNTTPKVTMESIGKEGLFILRGLEKLTQASSCASPR